MILDTDEEGIILSAQNKVGIKATRAQCEWILTPSFRSIRDWRHRKFQRRRWVSSRHWRGRGRLGRQKVVPGEVVVPVEASSPMYTTMWSDDASKCWCVVRISRLQSMIEPTKKNEVKFGGGTKKTHGEAPSPISTEDHDVPPSHRHASGIAVPSPSRCSLHPPICPIIFYTLPTDPATGLTSGIVKEDQLWREENTVVEAFSFEAIKCILCFRWSSEG